MRGQNRLRQLCDLHTAGDPTATTVYPVEFFVDNSENCHLVTIGSWGSDPNPSSYPNALNVGREEITNNFAKNLHDLKNKIHFITAYINPPNRDAWTEGTASQWSFTQTGTGGTTTLSDDSTNFKVGGKSIHLNWTGQSTGSTGVLLRYPSANNLGLDVTTLGGKITPATLRFYVRANLTAKYVVNVLLDTGGSDANQFVGPLLPKGNDSTGAQNTFKNDSNWNLIEVSIGPYGDAWASAGSPVWTNVSQIIIQVQWPPTQITAGDVWIDGLYLEGQNHFVATDSTRISQFGTRESTISSLKHRDSSSEKKLAKAELFRLHNAIIRGSIEVPGIADALPGQLVTVTAPSANLSAATLRVLTVKHSYTAAGFRTTLDLTDDVTNYQALQLTSIANLLLVQYVPKRISQRERDETGGQPITLSGMQDPTTSAQVQDYPS